MDGKREENWREVVRKMLPPGAPLPGEESARLDYSIAMEYEGPPVSYEVPKVEPVEVGPRKPIPTADPASKRSSSTSGQPGAPVVEPIRLPVSTIAGLTDPSPAGSPASSESVVSVLHNPDLSSASASPGSARRRARAPVVTFNTLETKRVIDDDGGSEEEDDDRQVKVGEIVNRLNL